MNILFALLIASAQAAPAKKTAAIPEEARRAFVRGNTAFTDAKSPEDFLRAAARFEEATKLAPKWPDPLFNLAKAREAASDFEGARAALKAYLALPLPAAEKRQALDLSYALEEKGVSKAKEAAKASEAASVDRFVGHWTAQFRAGGGGMVTNEFSLERSGAGLRMTGPMAWTKPSEFTVNGNELTFTAHHTVTEANGEVWVTADVIYAGVLSADGRSMAISLRSVKPYNARQAAHAENWGPPHSVYTATWTKD